MQLAREANKTVDCRSEQLGCRKYGREEVKRGERRRSNFDSFALGADDGDVRWLGACKLAATPIGTAPQPSLTQRSIAREMQLHLPLAPLQNSGYGLKTLPQHAKHCATWLPCASVHAACCAAYSDISNAAYCAGRALVRALCNVIDAKNALASKPAQIDHRLHGPAGSRLETTNHRSERLHRGGQMPHLAGNKAKLCILELSVSPTILTGTAPFVPLLISIGPEYYYLAARTWRCQELHSFRG